MSKNIELTIVAKEFYNLVSLTEQINEINSKLKEYHAMACIDFDTEREISKLNARRGKLIRAIGNAMYEIMQEYVSEES